ncbi:glycerol kinase GlpK [Sphingomonas sp. IC4-52]|uniref:glycerol kinase GlpK n=1 Tax=Sphingomonas sp. IC4-52 TaxID=2887202 RepID=UPI001D115295|nr:glycerol kinase GlpK [Sphingomonas sp. IC4-52]MCC2979801.1 glycerol kinase GlpK [Sphingomonas sp. IC4-52]
MAAHILVIDQGTTSTRSILFDESARRVAIAQVEFPQYYPAHGWVEHDPEDIWRDTLATARQVIGNAGIDPADVTGIGITNQRETAVIWDRATGQPIHRAIVWQDRRGADLCARLRADGAEDLIRARTGLLIDPYFSATKIAWMLDHVQGARARAERGELAFGTIDAFLLWRLTGGRVHATDVTNASRTMLFDIHRGSWDEELCRLLGVPLALLPDVHDNAHVYGATDRDLLGAAIPIAGMAGDQQAALFGQACFDRGAAKSTYGTGCFMLLNTGADAVTSQHRLLTTPAYRLNGETTYALEGSIFVAGAAVKWLRDGLGIITHAGQTNDMATQVPDSHGVYMVPAFVGLGAPHWDPAARGAIYGLTLDTSPAHLARAALEAVAYQTLDLAEAMMADGGGRPERLRVDGGMAANDWLCGFLADLIGTPVERPGDLETTARGAAFHAGLATGLWSGLDALAALWSRDRQFDPAMAADVRAPLVAGWRDAVRRTLSAT